MALNLLKNPLRWLSDALGLDNPPLPTGLWTEAVYPFVDVAQQGWWDLEVAVPREVSFTDATRPAELEIIPASRTRHQYLLYLSLSRSNGVGAGEFALFFVPANSSAPSVSLTNPNIPAAVVETWEELTARGFPRRIFIPRGFRLVWFPPAMPGVGETWSVQWCVASQAYGGVPLLP